MPSPNGFFDCGAVTNIDRNWFRFEITHDINNPPWDTPNAGSYEFELNIGTAPGGPFTAAPLTAIANQCSPDPDNLLSPGGVTSTLTGIGGPAELLADTDYYVEIVLRDPADVEVDRFVCGPVHTEAYPTFACGGGATGPDAADVFLGSLTGRVNTTPPCNRDSIVWEIATTPGGPYTPAPSEPVTGLSPSHTFTGLSPNTQYYWRARLSEQAQSGAEYLTTQECTFTTEAVPLNPACTFVGPATSTTGPAQGTADSVPTDHTMLLALGTTPGGPYPTESPAAAGTNTAGQTVNHTFTGLTPSTTYYFRTEVRDAVNALVEASTECTFTTPAAPEPPGPNPFQPVPCAADSGGGAGADVEQTLLCDLDAQGNILGTALAVYEYDSDGNPAGAPTFVDPATGDPYVAQGTLQPCPGETGCLAPVQFCFTSTSTGPVDHPGRQYDITLPINPGFPVETAVIGGVTHPANITWSIFDTDGDDFAAELETFLQGRIGCGTVTVTNPNSGTVVCGPAIPMQIHIECCRLDEDPPDLVELIYNGGQDLVQNPAYLTTPPTNLQQFQFHYLRRQDQGGTLNCTSVANRGWETNDDGGDGPDFEIWGQGPGGLQTISNTTPTPRGTPVQEIAADVSGGPNPNPTIWQTFQVTTGGNFRIVLTHGARDPGEVHTIRLSTGDTNDTGPGDIINNVTNPPSVTNSGGPNPWTTLDQTVPLGPGVYTLSLETTQPAGANRGGLFTDMRVYIDAAGERATAVTDDETCVVTVEETTTVTDCQLWAPECLNGQIVSWRNVETGEQLTNAAFWGQAPAPECCLPEAAEGGGGNVNANLVHNYEVCGLVGGLPTTLNRVVITDASGGVLAEQFIGPDGGPVTPASYTIGSCNAERYVNDEILCDDNGSFLRKYVQTVGNDGLARVNNFRDFTLAGGDYSAVGQVGTCSLDTEIVELCDVQASGVSVPFLRVFTYDENGAVVSVENQDANGAPYAPTGTVTLCELVTLEQELLCDDGNGGAPFFRTIVRAGGVYVTTQDTDLDGITPYVAAGPVGACGGDVLDRDREVVCWTQTSTGTTVHTGTIRHDDALPPPGWLLFDQHQTLVLPTEPGLTFVPCGGTAGVDAETLILCDANGTRFLRTYTYDAAGEVDGFTDTTFAGAPFAPVGAVGACPAAATDSESFVLCSSTPAAGTRFLRTYTYTAAGAVAGFTDTTLAGAPFAPGTVTVCPQTVQSDTDFVEELLCDANGTAFLRLFRFDSTNGNLLSTTNTTLAGAAFAPVGAVGPCSNCCPQVIGQGCTNTGSGFYTAIRATNGTITLIDSVTGAAVAAANIVACPSDNTVRTLNAQARLVTDADPAWTPGTDVVGTLTSVTMTVLTGTATLTDQSGTVLAGLPAGFSATWNAEDDNTLLGPTSIDAVGGSTVVHWTQR